MTELEPQAKILHYNGVDALAYQDVLVVPAYSDVESRHGKQIDTSTTFARGAPRINIPYMSAGMDTVTGVDMAITMALNGGIGELHRNMLPADQADATRQVKEKMRVKEENPPVLGEGATIQDALDLIRRRKRGYVAICEGGTIKGRFLGMATEKDFAADSSDTPLTHVMIPFVLEPQPGQRHLVVGVPGIQLPQAVEIMKKCRVEKLPVVHLVEREGSPDGEIEPHLVGIFTKKDDQYIQSHPYAAVDSQGRLMVAPAIGVKEIDVERALMLVEAGADALILDIAHGHSVHTKRMLDRLKIKEGVKVPIIAGNVATAKGVIFAYDNGADGVKVGVGPGSVCWTRNIAGTGVPQLTAILEAREAMEKVSDPIPIIADGGIREPGDVVKAIAAGADVVMMGGALAGTDRAPGSPINVDGTLFMEVRGMASLPVFRDRQRMGESSTDATRYAPEGKAQLVPYKGETERIFYQYVGGLLSGMSYAGAHTIYELQRAQLVKVSPSGSTENSRVAHV